MRKIIVAALAVLWGCRVQAQVLDQIVAVIGDKIILSSDVDNLVTYYLQNGQKDDGGLRCRVMEELIVSKLMVNKAEQDSLEISEGQVSSEVDRRVQVFIQQMGSQEEFERVYGKPLIQAKEDFQEEIREQLLIERQRSEIVETAKITPREVKEFFNSIPRDSIGLLPAEVQLNHIVLNIPWSEDSKRKAQEDLRNYRKQITEGADFADLARKYSEDGSARSGGSLGTFGRGQMVPKFEDVVFNMREGDMSDIFETEYGYHVVKLYKKRGEQLTASHILKKPKADPKGDSIIITRLNKIRNRVLSDSITFEQAAILYSEDRATKDCGGCITNTQTGELSIPLDALEADLFFKIDEMKPGEISKPIELLKRDGSRSYHIIYLKKKIPPHIPNLNDDYKTLYNAALRAKQGGLFEKWIEQAKKNIYIDIKPTECYNALKSWTQ